MNNRKKFLLIWGTIYLVVALVMYFGLKLMVAKKFSAEKMEQMVAGAPRSEAKVKDLCKIQLLGEPKVGKDYVKMVFWCTNGTKAISTFALNAFKDKTINGILDEYSRIVNFDGKLSQSSEWNCLVNDKKMAVVGGSSTIIPASTIDCYQK